MRRKKQYIYTATLKIILNELRDVISNDLLKRMETTTQRKVFYIQGDPRDEVWEAIKLAGTYWKYLELLDAYADFARSLEPFAWYSTLTFIDHVHPEQAKRCFIRWIRNLNESVVGRRYRERRIPGISWIMALERQQRGVFHFHVLLEHPHIDKITYERALDLWRNVCIKTGKVNRIERYDEGRGACAYLGKSILINGEINYSERITWSRRADIDGTLKNFSVS
jgi:hypothetical protein